MKIQKALVTGASGFIGGRLRDALLADGVDVVAIRRGGSPASSKGRSVEAAYDDVDSLRAVVSQERPDVVFHVAGVTKGVTFEDFRNGNVTPTANLLAALKAEHPKLRRFVQVSSQTSYGPSTPSRPTIEDDPRRPVEFYGRSKLEAEILVERSGLPFTIVRPSGVYGPGDVDFLELFRAASMRTNLFFGNEAKWGSFIYVDDCVRGTLMAATHDATLNRGYFLTDDVPTTWGAFQQLIVDAMPHRVFTVRLPEAFVSLAAMGGEFLSSRDGKARLMNRQKAIMSAQDAWTCSGARARAEFGFEAEVTQREGIARTDRWYREQNWYRLR